MKESDSEVEVATIVSKKSSMLKPRPESESISKKASSLKLPAESVSVSEVNKKPSTLKPPPGSSSAQEKANKEQKETSLLKAPTADGEEQVVQDSASSVETEGSSR
jgi:hypothetical protein